MFYIISYVREENIPAEAIGGVRERSLAAEDALRLRLALDLHWAPVCCSSVRGERHHVSLQLLHHVHAAFLGYVVQTQYGLLVQFVVLYVQSILVFACFKSLRSCSGNRRIPSRAPRVEHSRSRAADKLDSCADDECGNRLSHSVDQHIAKWQTRNCIYIYIYIYEYKTKFE